MVGLTCNGPGNYLRCDKIHNSNFIQDNAEPKTEIFIARYIVHSLYQAIVHIREKQGRLALN